MIAGTDVNPDPDGGGGWDFESGVRSPLEAYSGYRGEDWTPQRLAFHQNLTAFAERVGLIVGLQSNGKMSQDEAYVEICRIWKDLKESKKHLLADGTDQPA